MKKTIEFVHQPTQSTTYNPHIICIDIEDISIYEQINKYFCKLTTKNSNTFNIFGSYRVIGNRISHTHLKNNKIYEDTIIRPSIALMYKKNTIEVSNVLMDAGQMKAFIDAYHFQENLEEAYCELIEDTYNNIKQLPENFWQIK